MQKQQSVSVIRDKFLSAIQPDLLRTLRDSPLPLEELRAEVFRKSSVSSSFEAIRSLNRQLSKLSCDGLISVQRGLYALTPAGRERVDNRAEKPAAVELGATEQKGAIVKARRHERSKKDFAESGHPAQPDDELCRRALASLVHGSKLIEELHRSIGSRNSFNADRPMLLMVMSVLERRELNGLPLVLKYRMPRGKYFITSAGLEALKNPSIRIVS